MFVPGEWSSAQLITPTGGFADDAACDFFAQSEKAFGGPVVLRRSGIPGWAGWIYVERPVVEEMPINMVGKKQTEIGVGARGCVGSGHGGIDARAIEIDSAQAERRFAVPRMKFET